MLKIITRTILYNLFKLDLSPIDYNVGWGLRDKESHLFLWGEKTADLFKSKQSVSVLGNILMDNQYNRYYKNQRDQKLLNELGLDQNKRTVLLSAQCIQDDENNQLIDWYIQLAKKSNRYNIIVKIHPRDDSDIFKIIKDFKNVKVVVNGKA